MPAADARREAWQLRRRDPRGGARIAPWVRDRALAAGRGRTSRAAILAAVVARVAAVTLTVAPVGVVPAGCGGGDAVAADAGPPAEDGGAAGDAAAVAFEPTPPAPPEWRPCPPGWRETDDDGLALCDPWPESGRETSTAPDAAFYFCSVSCWDAHLPEAHHREAWAEEKRAPPA